MGVTDWIEARVGAKGGITLDEFVLDPAETHGITIHRTPVWQARHTLGECHELCLSGQAHAGLFQIRSRIEAILEHDSEPVTGGKPFSNIPAAVFEVSDGQINQFQCGLLGRERPPRLD